MPLAPPFTRENAAENARKATVSREANRLSRLMASLPERAQGRAVVQVNKILKWMDKENDRDKYAQLCAMLDKLWNMAYPKAGVMRPGRSKERKSMPQASESPQPIVSCVPEPEPKPTSQIIQSPKQELNP